MRRFLLWFLPKRDRLRDKAFNEIRPGFRGPVPYVLPLRYLFLIVIILRFCSYRPRGPHDFWVAPLIFVAALLTSVATYLTFHPPRKPQVYYGLLVVADLLTISWAYRLTDDPNSGIVLLYCLPVFTAADFLRTVDSLLLLAATEACLIYTATSLQLVRPPMGVLDLFLKGAVIRGSFFLSIVAVTALVIRVEGLLRKTVSRREEQLKVLLEFKAEADMAKNEAEVLPLAVKKAMSLVSMDGDTAGAALTTDGLPQDLRPAYSHPADFLESDDGKAIIDDIVRPTLVRGNTHLENQDRPQWPYTKRVVYASLCVPVILRNTPIAILFLRRVGRYRFNQSDSAFLKAFAGHAAAAVERLRLTSALNSLAAALPSALELDRQLESIVSELTDSLGFEFATVFLVDEYRGVVEAARGRNVPFGSLNRAKYPLDGSDIQAHIVRSKTTEVLSGWDPRFNRDIFERFEHAEVARVFAPILADGEAVGTIVAGCSLERKDEIITPSNVAKVREIGEVRGKAIGRTRPHVLLEMIAQSVIDIMGADSASIHVYRKGQMSDRSAEERGEPILAAAAGRATKQFIRDHQPRPGGLGETAIRKGEIRKIDDPQKLAAEKPDLYQLGVRAMAAFPLTCGKDVDGVLYVHYWDRAHQFTTSEMELGTLFTRQMEVVIQNHLLITSTMEPAARAWELSRMQNLMQSLASPFVLQDVLEEVARNVLMMVDADNVTLYEYNASADHFVTPPVMKGKFYDEAAMLTAIHSEDTPRSALAQRTPQFFPKISDVPALTGPKLNGRIRFVEREKIVSCAIVPLRAGARREVMGLLFVNYRSPREFGIEDRNIINILADSAALAIRTARLYEPRQRELERRRREMEAMRAVEQALVKSAPDLPQVLQLILEKILDITAAHSGEFMLLDRWQEKPLVSAARFPLDLPTSPQAIGEGIIGLAALKKGSILVGDVKSPEWNRIYKEVIAATRSELAVPLLEPNGDLLGVLNIESNRTNGFSRDDQSLIETVAVQAVIAIHSVRLYDRLERRIRHLGALNMIAARIQERPYELDTILRLFLTGITAGAGLGFSRAMLFLADNTGKFLRGEMAVGAVTKDEAEKVWETFQKDFASPGNLEFVLIESENFSDALKDGRVVEYPPLSAEIRRVSKPIDAEAGAIAQCLLTGKTTRVQCGQPDPFRDVIRNFTHPNDLDQAFVCVPLAGKQTKRVGALVVDNRFLIKEREINDEDVAGLEAFARLLALSVENDRLREGLAERQKVENWKEVTAEIAHVVGTRLSATAGQLTRLNHYLEDSNLANDATPETKALLDRLSEGIKKAEKVLLEFRTFTAASQLEPKALDLRNVLADVCKEIEAIYIIKRVFPDKPLPVLVDVLKLGNALLEIIKNAQEAITNTTRAAIIEITSSAEPASGDRQPCARIEITDSGPGIPAEIRQKIFQPFFTTKNGTGLGLAIAKAIIDAHGGTIRADDHFSGGARLVIHIPLMVQPSVNEKGSDNG